jgi:plastocyanin
MTQSQRVAVTIVATLVILLGACQQKESERPTPIQIDPATVGTVSGEVRFDGLPPPPTVLQLAAWPECITQHGGPIGTGDALVHGDGKVENVLVYVKEGLGGRVFTVPDTPVVIDQKGCVFVPRVAAAQVGQPVRFLNSDPLLHNVHGGGWNFSLGTVGASRTTSVPTEQPIIALKCDIHPWMVAYLGVFAHPYFAVTGPDGHFTLENLPQGSYVIEAWHERFGTRTANVSLRAKETKAVGFTFAAS